MKWISRLLLWPAGLVWAAAAPAANYDYLKEVEELCRFAPCRPAGPVGVTDETAATRQILFPPSPFVVEGVLQLRVGETLHFEAEVEEGKLVRIRKVDRIREPSRTFTVSVFQTPGENTAGWSAPVELEAVLAAAEGLEARPHHTWMVVRHPFRSFLKFSALLNAAGTDGPEETTSCPVPPRYPSVEHWPYIVFQIFLSDLRLVDYGPGEKIPCD